MSKKEFDIIKEKYPDIIINKHEKFCNIEYPNLYKLDISLFGYPFYKNFPIFYIYHEKLENVIKNNEYNYEITNNHPILSLCDYIMKILL